MIMKKLLIMFSTILLILTFGFAVSAVYESEPNNSIIDADSISCGSTVNGNIAVDNDQDYYAFTLASSGRISIKFNSYIECYSLIVYDEDGKEVWYSEYNNWISTTGQVSNTHIVDLEKGTYYLVVKGSIYHDWDSEYTGNYNFNIKFTASGANVAEPNNSIAEAKDISFDNTIKGQLAKNDGEDYYKVTLSSSGRITIKINSYIEYYCMVLYDWNGKKIWYTQDNRWAETTGSISNTHSIDLEKGTYYLAVRGAMYHDWDSVYTGNYNFNIKFTASGANIAEPNNSIAEAKAVSFDKTVKGQIAKNDGEDYYKITLPSSGRITIKFNSYVEYYSMILYDCDGKKMWYTQDNRWAETTGSISNTHSIDLEKGTYYLAVRGAMYHDWDSVYTGNYNFNIKFTASGANIAEPNNSIAEAKTISFTSNVKGQIAINDGDDYYRVSVPSSGKIVIRFNSFLEYYSLILYDTDGKEVWYTDCNEWISTTKKRSDTFTVDLSKGTYYLLVKGSYWRDGKSEKTGNYNFTVSQKITVASVPSISAKQSETAVALSWGAASNVNGYRIYRYDVKAKKYVQIGETTARKFVVKKLKAGTKYTFAVKAFKKVNGAVYLSPSFRVIDTATKPVAPTIKAAGGNKCAILKSTKQAANGFVVFRAESKNGSFKRIAVVKGNTLAFKNQKLKSGKTYYYKVRAYVTAGGRNVYGAYSQVKAVKAK